VAAIKVATHGLQDILKTAVKDKPRMNTDKHGLGIASKGLTFWVSTIADASLSLSVFIRVHPWSNAVFRFTVLKST